MYDRRVFSSTLCDALPSRMGSAVELRYTLRQMPTSGRRCRDASLSHSGRSASWFVSLHDNPANVGVTATASRLAESGRACQGCIYFRGCGRNGLRPALTRSNRTMLRRKNAASAPLGKPRDTSQSLRAILNVLRCRPVSKQLSSGDVFACDCMSQHWCD